MAWHSPAAASTSSPYDLQMVVGVYQTCFEMFGKILSWRTFSRFPLAHDVLQVPIVNMLHIQSLKRTEEQMLGAPHDPHDPSIQFKHL